MDLHGGNIYKNKVDLDYSANINPFSLPKKLKKELKKNLETLENYPEADYLNLRKAISKSLNIDKKFIITGNGASELIFLYIKALKPKKSLLLAPSFAEYKRALETVDSSISYFYLKEKEDFNLNKNLFLKELEKSYDFLVLCNPNNPSSKLIKKEALIEIIKKAKKFNTKILIDEAFIDFTDFEKENTIINEKFDNILILRAFTKFFAIPGLRLGYAVSYNKRDMEEMYRLKEPWTINSLASIAGEICLEDKKYIKKTKKWIKEEKKFMYKELKKIKDIKVYKGSVNFLLIRLKKITAKNLRKKLIKQKILIRDASNFDGLEKNFIRVAIKKRKDNIRLIKAIKKGCRND